MSGKMRKKKPEVMRISKEQCGVRHACCPDESRYEMRYVFVDDRAAVSTDGKILAMVDHDECEPWKHGDIFLDPAKIPRRFKVSDSWADVAAIEPNGIFPSYREVLPNVGNGYTVSEVIPHDLERITNAAIAFTRPVKKRQGETDFDYPAEITLGTDEYGNLGAEIRRVGGGELKMSNIGVSSPVGDMERVVCLDAVWLDKLIKAVKACGVPWEDPMQVHWPKDERQPLVLCHGRFTGLIMPRQR